MKEILMNYRNLAEEIVFILLLLFAISYSPVAYSQEISKNTIVPMQGPAMYCGDKNNLKNTLDKYKEQEFVALTGHVLSNDNPYYILYRNFNTGSWSLIVYNVRNAPKDVACLMSGGEKSFVVPDIKALTEMLNKQDKGFDPPVPTNNERSS